MENPNKALKELRDQLATVEEAILVFERLERGRKKSPKILPITARGAEDPLFKSRGKNVR